MVTGRHRLGEHGRCWDEGTCQASEGDRENGKDTHAVAGKLEQGPRMWVSCFTG